MSKRGERKKAGAKKRPPAPEKVASTARFAFERERLLHELQANQVELEAQNCELRETQQLLELSRDRYADLYDFAPLGYVTLDGKGLIQEINLTAAGMLGVERSQLIGLPFNLYVVKPDQPAFREHLRNLARPERSAATELGLTVKGGGTIQVELKSIPVLDALRKTRLCRSTLTDITVRKQVEKTLRNNEARLRAIFDTVVEGIVTIDERGVIESYNPAAARMFGYTAADIIGQNIGLLVPWLDRDRHGGFDADNRATGEGKLIGIGREVVGRRKDGSNFPLDLSLSEVPLANRRIFTGILRDITEHKRDEDALRRSEANLTSAQKIAHVGSYEVDVPSGKSLHWSAETFRIMGLDPAQQALSPQEYQTRVVHPDDQARVREAIQRTMNEAARYDVEYRIVRPNDSIRHVHSAAEPVLGPDKKVIKIIGVVQDITERKRAEEALIESEALKLDVLNSLPANIAVLDKDGTIIAINEAWRRFAQENNDSLVSRNGIGTNYFDVCRNATSEASGDASKALAGIQAVLAGSQESFSTEFACDSPTTERWFLMSVTPLSRSRGGAVVAYVDITARKQAQLARSRLAAIVESSSDAIIGSTLDGTITDWNKGAEAMLGYSADEIVGQSISMLYPAARMDELRRIDQQIQRGEVVHPFETLRIRKDRSAINVAITLSPIKEAGENITGISANLRDITERKRLEKEILEVSEREQSRIGQDLHDGLCQQLAGIEFRLLALKQKLESKSKKEIAETKKLAKMVRQGIEQTRTLARGLSPVMLETDGLMNALQELAINTKEMFNISCSFNCPAPLPIHDNAVATHLYRIAQEAVQNAIRHGKAKFVVINLFTQNDRIVLGVKDDGVGFSRKPRNHKGMGLHIMQYRAGMVGGSLAVQREAEGGTSVICSLSAEATQETARSKANEGR